MSNTMDQTLAFWQSEWDRVCIQLDAFNCLIRISFEVYYSLDVDGRNFFVQKASALLNKPVEFFVDSTNLTRVFLANRWDISSAIPCQLEQYSAAGLPRIFPIVPIEQLVANASDSSMPSTSSSRGSISSASSYSENDFRLGTPIRETGSNSSTQQSTPVNAEFGKDIPINFANPGFSSLPGQGYGAPQAQDSAINVGFMPNLNFDFSTPVGAPAYPIQQYSPTSQTNNHMASAGQSPTRKRNKSNNNNNDDDDEGNKRSCNAFILFRRSQHAIIAAQNPGIQNGDISRIISSKWAAMTDLEKDQWYEEADRLSLERWQQYPNAKYRTNVAKIEKRRGERAARAAAAERQAELMAQEQPQPQPQEEQLQERVGNNEKPLEQLEQAEPVLDQVEHSDLLPQQSVAPELLQKHVEIQEEAADEGDVSFYDLFGGDELNDEFDL
ncbi:hypothetical protein GGR58DRAFT_528519 [Xylaria digitata]|nr:hypothetical protein GGR58DRAFT_528519 [Xylaria digitata]